MSSRLRKKLKFGFDHIIVNEMAYLPNSNVLVHCLIEKDWADDVLQIYRTKSLPTTEKKQQLMQKYKDLYNEILNADADSEASLYESSQTSNTLPQRIGYGKYRKMFAQDFCKEIESKFGKDGKKLSDMDSKVR